MVIKVFFAVLVLCTVAVAAVILAIHFRVKRHLSKAPGASATPEAVGVERSSGATAAREATGEQRLDGEAGR